MRKFKRILKFFIIVIILIPILLLSLYLVAKIKPKLSIESANKFYIYDSKDTLVDDLNDNWVKLDDISDNVIKATISIEDKNFYKHSGFDYLRIL